MRRNSNNISDLIVKFETKESSASTKDHDDRSVKKIYVKKIERRDHLDQVSKKEIHEEKARKEVVTMLSRCGRFLDFLSRLPLPWMSVTGMGITFLVTVFIFPRAITENFLFPAFRLLFGTLYPAYASYKAVRTKNVKEYVKWMMYWIVYAFFTCIETFTDIFLSWFPFYYEVKVILVIWLLSPATKGSSTLYRKFVHPMLTRREHEIDEYLNQAKEKGYTTVLQLGSKGMNYATSVIMQTAIKGGGNLVQTLKKSYSLSDLSEPDTQRTQDEIDEITRPQRTQRVLRPRTQSMRSASGGRNVPEMYFPEVDVPHSRTSRDGVPNYNYIRSSEDISSGYSSAEPMPVALSRTASLSHASRGATRLRSKRSEAGENSWEDDGEGDYPFSPSSCPQSPISLSSMSSQNFQKFHYSSDGEPLFLVEEEDDPEMIDGTRIMDVTENDPEFRQVFHVGRKQYDTKMEEKYRLFEIWLKNQQNSVKDPSSFSEDFQDTFSDHNSSEEEFHELDGGDNTESSPMLNEAQQEANNEDFPKCESNEIKEDEEPKELIIIEDTNSLTEDLNTNFEDIKEPKNVSEEATKCAENDQTSILELERLDDDTITKEFSLKDDTIIPESVKEILPSSNKKTPCHSKGKAPEPPTAIPQISSPASVNEEEAAKSPEKKAISKKSKFLNYLPGILRTDSTAKSTSTDKLPRETSI